MAFLGGLGGRLFAKFIFVDNPKLEIFPFLMYRSIICGIILVLILNRKIKYVAWDSVEKENVNGLLLKIAQGVVITIVSYAALFYWPMTILTAIATI